MSKDWMEENQTWFIVANICTVYFIIIEVLQVFEKRIRYLKNTYNWMDMVSLSLNAILLTHMFFGLPLIQVLVLVALALQWVKAFYWMRLFQLTARFIRIIKQTIKDIVGFTLLLFVAIAMFANIIYMAN